MAAEGEFEQYVSDPNAPETMTLPRASFQLIQLCLKEASARCDEARELVRGLREGTK